MELHAPHKASASQRPDRDLHVGLLCFSQTPAGDRTGGISSEESARMLGRGVVSRPTYVDHRNFSSCRTLTAPGLKPRLIQFNPSLPQVHPDIMTASLQSLLLDRRCLMLL